MAQKGSGDYRRLTVPLFNSTLISFLMNYNGLFDKCWVFNYFSSFPSRFPVESTGVYVGFSAVGFACCRPIILNLYANSAVVSLPADVTGSLYSLFFGLC